MFLKCATWHFCLRVSSGFCQQTVLCQQEEFFWRDVLSRLMCWLISLGYGVYISLPESGHCFCGRHLSDSSLVCHCLPSGDQIRVSLVGSQMCAGGQWVTWLPCLYCGLLVHNKWMLTPTTHHKALIAGKIHKILFLTMHWTLVISNTKRVMSRNSNLQKLCKPLSTWIHISVKDQNEY